MCAAAGMPMPRTVARIERRQVVNVCSHQTGPVLTCHVLPDECGDAGALQHMMCVP